MHRPISYVHKTPHLKNGSAYACCLLDSQSTLYFTCVFYTPSSPWPSSCFRSSSYSLAQLLKKSRGFPSITIEYTLNKEREVLMARTSHIDDSSQFTTIASAPSWISTLFVFPFPSLTWQPNMSLSLDRRHRLQERTAPRRR